MLLHGMEVNQDNLNDWGSGTLEKIRKDLEEKITKQQGKCPYCQGVKRIRNDLVHYTFRHIVKIQNGNE